MKTLPLTDIAFPVKLSKPAESYKTEGIHVRALRYAHEVNPNWQVRIGQDYYYTFIIPETEEIIKGNRKHKKTKKELKENPSEELYETKEVEIKKPINVMAFDFDSEHIKKYKIDYDELIDRSIYKKCESIFEGLKWNIGEIK
jgi:hypothetical protein